jgi:hypothetical protein
MVIQRNTGRPKDAPPAATKCTPADRAQGSLCRYLCTSIANHAHLCGCDACACWWIENEREAHVISEAEARTTFVEYFTALDPSSAR